MTLKYTQKQPNAEKKRKKRKKVDMRLTAQKQGKHHGFPRSILKIAVLSLFPMTP